MIAIPSGDTWHAAFGVSLAGAISKFMTYKVAEDVTQQSLEIHNIRSSLLMTSREEIIQDAYRKQCTHILMLDSDMQFPNDTIHRLFKCNRDFVGANYARKCIPSTPTSANLMDEVCYTDSHMECLEEVGHIGLGICLLRMDALKGLEPPFFKVEWHEEMQTYIGEDVYFCRKLREHGIPIYVDHALSQYVGHIGSFRYDHSVVGEVVDDKIEEAANA
jgi:hypothetical protein